MADKKVRRRAIARMSDTRRIDKLARSYAMLDKVAGIPDLNAAIDLARSYLQLRGLR